MTDFLEEYKKLEQELIQDVYTQCALLCEWCARIPIAFFIKRRQHNPPYSWYHVVTSKDDGWYTGRECQSYKLRKLRGVSIKSGYIIYL